MKRINIENYTVLFKEKEMPYDIKGSIKNVLLNPQLQLDSVKLFESINLWNKIKDEQKEIILEDAEYNYLKKCLDFFKGYLEQDYEFVKRIQNAENYEIKK